MTIVYFLNAIYNILSFFCRINNEEFVIDDLYMTTNTTLIKKPLFMTFFVDDILLPI
jgi:hypothetical protein